MVEVFRSTRIAVSEEPYALFEQLYDLGVTDGLPVIPPSEDLVDSFVKVSGRPADLLVALVPPLNGRATIEKIAINAVMAGCRPNYMGLLIAAVEAVCDPAFNLNGIQCTTNPVSPMLIVNGPIRHDLDLNCGRGILGPGRRANSTIGRALRLIMLNVGGAVPGDVDKAIHGMPGKYTMCFGELEEESPWEPLHVERGLLASQSSVTAVGAQGTNNLCIGWKQADSVLQGIANGMATYTNNNYTLGGHPVLIFNPGHAKLLAEQGYSKGNVKKALYEQAKVAMSAWPKEPLYSQTLNRPVFGDWNYPTHRPDDILIVVAGGPEAYHNTYCANFGDTAAVTKPVL